MTHTITFQLDDIMFAELQRARHECMIDGNLTSADFCQQCVESELASRRLARIAAGLPCAG